MYNILVLSLLFKSAVWKCRPFQNEANNIKYSNFIIIFGNIFPSTCSIFFLSFYFWNLLFFWYVLVNKWSSTFMFSETVLNWVTLHTDSVLQRLRQVCPKIVSVSQPILISSVKWKIAYCLWHHLKLPEKAKVPE